MGGDCPMSSGGSGVMVYWCWCGSWIGGAGVSGVAGVAGGLVVVWLEDWWCWCIWCGWWRSLWIGAGVAGVAGGQHGSWYQALLSSTRSSHHS